MVLVLGLPCHLLQFLLMLTHSIIRALNVSPFFICSSLDVNTPYLRASTTCGSLPYDDAATRQCSSSIRRLNCASSANGWSCIVRVVLCGWEKDGETGRGNLSSLEFLISLSLAIHVLSLLLFCQSGFWNTTHTRLHIPMRSIEPQTRYYTYNS